MMLLIHPYLLYEKRKNEDIDRCYHDAASYQKEEEEEEKEQKDQVQDKYKRGCEDGQE